MSPLAPGSDIQRHVSWGTRLRFHWLICLEPGRGCLQQLRQVGTAAPVQSHRYRPSCRSGQLSFEQLGLDIRDKANYRFLSSKCVTLMRTFFDLKSLWAIDGFTPWPLFAPSSPGWQFSWGLDFKVLLLSQKNRKQTVKVRQSFGHCEAYLDQVLN